MRKKRVVLGLFFCLCLAVTSCARTEKIPDAKEELIGRIGKDRATVGCLYDASAQMWEGGYTPEGLLAYLFPDTDGKSPLPEALDDYALYLSPSPEGGEAAVFVCRDRARARDVSRVCLLRASLVRETLPGLTGAAPVVVRGRVVYYALLAE